MLKRILLVLMMGMSTNLMAQVEIASLPEALPEPTAVVCPPRTSAFAAGFGNESGPNRASGSMPGIANYHWTTVGSIMGLEWQVLPRSQQWQIGIALRYDHTHVDKENFTNIDPDFDWALRLDSIRGILYSRLEFCNPVYITAMLSYAFNEYHGYRDTNLPVLTVPPTPPTVALGNYDGQQFNTQVALGYKWTKCHFIVTPEVSLDYSDLQVDAYTETGADTANLFIPSKNAKALKLGFDLNLAYKNVFPRAQVHPYVHAKVSHDAMYDPMQKLTAKSVLGGETGFIGPWSTPAYETYVIGAGIKVLGAHNVTVLMKYDYVMKASAHDHVMMLSIKHDW